ncbi:unnamed protein product [Amoebophrya sp. A25]|nr:unnamed protein product [Amoebophrya sp. A25]|eukprot:GSA25T00000876001.1
MSAFPAGSVSHQLVWWLKEGVTETDMTSIYDEMRNFPKSIPDYVLSVSVGTTFTDNRSDGAAAGAVIVLRDEASLPLYRDCEIHQEFVSRFAPKLSKLQCLDWVN